jgi:hypothetical protein
VGQPLGNVKTAEVRKNEQPLTVVSCQRLFVVAFSEAYFTTIFFPPLM